MLDLTNAFNSVSRPALLRTVRLAFPALAPWVETCYG